MQCLPFPRLCFVVAAATLAWSADSFLRANGPRVPLLAALAEPTFAPGAPGATLRLTGSFAQGDEVMVGASAVPTTFVSVTELQADVPAALLASPTTHRIRVRHGNVASAPLDLAVSDPRHAVVVNQTPMPVASEPSSVALAELNGDGRPDLVYFGSNSLQIALADGGGGFHPPASLGLTSVGTDLLAADLDGDAATDVLVRQGGSGLISVLRNDGTGIFTAGPTVNTGHADGPSTAVGDFDGNGALDILSANTTEGTIDVHLGAGDGTFASLPAFASIAGPMAPVIHDFDSDGTLDVIVLSAPTGALALHRGNGNGTFAGPSNIPVAAGTSSMLFSADVNADARLDLILPGRTPFQFTRLQVLLGQGDGTFAPPPAAVQPLTPLLQSLAATDVDADGALDVVGVWGGSTAYVLRGDRSGNFTPFSQLQLPISARRIVRGDLNIDGMPDFVVGGADFGFPQQPTLLQLLQEDPGPLPRLVLPDATFTETDSSSTIVAMPVLLVDAAGQPVASAAPIRITLTFFDGTAVAGEDYQPSPAPSFPIPQGVSEGQIDFHIVGGTQFEPTETFTVQIATAIGAVIQDGTATVTILDNDPPPPMADLSTTFVIADPVPPNAPVTGTLTVTNHGPAAANTPTGAIQIGFMDLAKLTNVRITDTSFQVPGVNGGLIRGQNAAPLAPGGDAFLTFTATPTAAANTPNDFAFTLANPTQLLPLSYAFNQTSSAGRTGVAFAADGDNQVNDLILHDPEPNVLRIVRNADTSATQTQVIDLEAAFPDYTVSTQRVCALGRAGSTLILTLVPEPGASSGESLLVTRDLPADSSAADFVEILRRSGLLGNAECVDIDGDGDEDVLSLDRQANTIIIHRNDGGTLTTVSETPAGLAHTRGFVVDDFDRDGGIDVLVEGSLDEPGLAFSSLAGNGQGGLRDGLTVTNHGFPLDQVVAMQGGRAFDPVANVRRSIDFNADGFPDLVVACTSCATGGAYGIVPLRNLGSASPGGFEVQTPMAIGVPGRTFGQISMLGTPLIDETIISLTAKDGFNAVLRNDTRPNADVFTLTPVVPLAQHRRVGGSGPSAIVPMNAFQDSEVDFLALDVRGGILFDVSGTAATLDPDPTNNVDVRRIGISPGPPDSFNFKVGARWTPNAAAQLRNLAPDPVVNSLNGARVYARDQHGNTVDAEVLSSSHLELTFFWPRILDEFRHSDAQVQLFAETAGGTGASVTPPVIEDEEPEPPVVTILDVTISEADAPAELVFTVSLSAPSTTPVTVAFGTADGADPATAASGVGDYQPNGGVLTFAPGETSKEVRILILPDALDEFDETFVVNLSQVSGATVGRAQAIGTIADDDAAPVLQWTNLSAVEGDAGTTRVVVTATMVAPPGTAHEGQPTTSGKTVTLDVSTSDVTATAGQDYSFLPKMFILAPGEGSAALDVDIHGDTIDEQDESFHFDIVAINVTTPSAVPFVIEDDDAPSDTEPPTITAPANLRALATNPEGATVHYPPPVVQDNQPGVSVACVPPSGSVFPIGSTTVTCTATDAAGNTAQATFRVTVRVGRPRVVTRVVGQGVTAPGSGVHYVDVELRNTGTGHARNLQIEQVTARTTRGRGAVTLNAQTGPLPKAVGNLEVGTAVVERVYLNVPATVSRLSLTVAGTMTGAAGTPTRSYSDRSAVTIAAR